MIDLHSHTLFSDGELIVSELVRHAVVKGYEVLNISDHVDYSNIELVVPKLVEACAALTGDGITVLAGMEITHCPLDHIGPLVERGRALGAQLVTMHGETLSEPVIPGTDAAAIEAGVDILAHPGLISVDEAVAAAERGVCLEITARSGHCLTNGHVAAVARETGAMLVFGTDSHSSSNLVGIEQAEKILRGASLTGAEIEKVWQNAKKLVEKALSRIKQ